MPQNFTSQRYSSELKCWCCSKGRLSQQITYSRLCAIDFCLSISQHGSSEWQVSWDSCTSNKLHCSYSSCWFLCNEESSWFLSDKQSIAWTYQAYLFTSFFLVNHHQFALYVKLHSLSNILCWTVHNLILSKILDFTIIYDFVHPYF